jgi:nitrogen fixation NifU-like protein
MVMEALGGLPPVKVHCSVLAEEALHAAIQDYRERLERGEAPRTEENDDAVRYV